MFEFNLDFIGLFFIVISAVIAKPYILKKLNCEETFVSTKSK